MTPFRTLLAFLLLAGAPLPSLSESADGFPAWIDPDAVQATAAAATGDRYPDADTKTRMPDTWSDFTVFEAPVPLLHAVYEIEAPAERPLVHRTRKGDVPDTVVFEEEPRPEGGTLHRWIARDVPRLFEEPAMPDWWTVAQRLLVSTVPDWETVSRWYWNLSLPRLESTTPAMEEKVRALTEDLPHRQARLEAIFHFVSRHIRYMGLTTEEEAPGYEPRDVHVTFENRYGVCRDKAALLVALLRLDGFEAFPVLIHVGPRKDVEVPQPFFNHAIVAVREPDGTYQLMDMTDETTRDLLPAYLGNRSYLVATPEGETLQTSPVRPAEENLVHIRTETALSESGDIDGTIHLRFEGINDNAYLGLFASIKPAERRRFFEGLLKRLFPGATLHDFFLGPEDLQDRTEPIEASLAFSAPDYAVRKGDTLLIPPPVVGTSVGMVNFILRQTGLHERRFPLLTEYACGINESFTLTLPDTLAAEPLSLPSFPPILHPALAWHLTMEQTENRLEGSGAFVLHVPEFDPDEYLELRALLGDIEYYRRHWPAVDLPERVPDIASEEADVSYAFRRIVLESSDDGTWTETHHLRKTVRTYAGIKDHAEILIPFHPVWDDVTLVEARVTSPDGTVHETRAEEINLMDAAWVASAPRYPAGKTLVVNLPGVRVGSAIDVVTRRTHQSRPFFCFRASFGGIEPVEQMEVVFDAPADVFPDIRLTGAADSVSYTEEKTGENRMRRTWISADPSSAAREDHLPPDWILHPTLFLSTGDWATYAAELDPRLTRAARDANEARRRAREITDSVPNPRARIRVLRDFVARHIRDAGPDFIRLPLDTLTPADRTLQDGYGHSADRAILLFAMLDAAGFDPAFVLASRQPGDSDIAGPLLNTPQRSLFSTVLIRLEHDGERLYLNDTDQYAELGATPNDGNLSLSLPEGRIGIVRATDPQRLFTRVEYDVRIGDDGEADIDIRRRFEGMAHAAARRRFEEMTPEDRRRYHQEAVSSLSQRATPVGALDTDFSRHPGEERFSVRIDRFAVRTDEHFYLHLPGALPSFSLRADHRIHPLWWNARRGEQVIHRIRPPNGIRIVAAPPTQAWSAPNGALSMRHTVHTPFPPGESGPDTWTLTADAEWRPGLIEPEAYPDLLEAHRRLHHPQTRILLLQ